MNSILKYLGKIFCLLALINSYATYAKTYVIGVEDVPYYPLYDFRNGNASYTSDLFNEFGRQYNHEFEFLPLPIKRFSMWLLEEQIDFKYPDNVRWNDNLFIDNKHVNTDTFIYSESTIKLVAGTITPVGKHIDRNNLKVLGTLLGFYPTQWIKQIENKKVVLYESSSTLVLLQQVLRGQVDGIDIEPSVVNHHLKLLGKPNALAINRNFTYEVYDYYLSTIKHEKVIKQFNQFLKDNQQFLKILREKYQIIDHRPYE